MEMDVSKGPLCFLCPRPYLGSAIEVAKEGFRICIPFSQGLLHGIQELLCSTPSSAGVCHQHLITLRSPHLIRRSSLPNSRPPPVPASVSLYSLINVRGQQGHHDLLTAFSLHLNFPSLNTVDPALLHDVSSSQSYDPRLTYRNFSSSVWSFLCLLLAPLPLFPL